MQLIPRLRNIYRAWVRLPWLDRCIYNILDALTDIYARLRSYSFPNYYIRRWKLNMLNELYEKETTDFFKKNITPGLVIMDIGAHIGYFTRIFSKLTGPKGKVYAFEADPENFALLQKNTKHFQNIKLFPMAISDSGGTVDFYRSNDKSGCHSTIPAEFRQKKISVPAVDLDSFTAANGIKKINLIKMDIEGGEPTALKGMARVLATSNEIVLVIEFNPQCLKQANTQPLDFLRMIESYGFTIFVITPNKLANLEAHDTLDYRSIALYPDFVNLYCTKKPTSFTPQLSQ